MTKVSKDNFATYIIIYHFILKGLKEGTTTIKFKHRNFVDNSINKTKEYTVKVNKKLEIFIKEIK